METDMYSSDELDNLRAEAQWDSHDEPFGGDQRAEDDDHEANADADYRHEAYHGR